MSDSVALLLFPGVGSDHYQKKSSVNFGDNDSLEWTFSKMNNHFELHLAFFQKW